MRTVKLEILPFDFLVYDQFENLVAICHHNVRPNSCATIVCHHNNRSRVVQPQRLQYKSYLY